MKECCANCKLRYNLRMSDYSHGGCIDKDVDNGFICMAFQDENLAILMVGIDEKNEQCECYTPKTTPRRKQ